MMDEAQQIKAQLVILSEYLQTTLSEPQILLYAKELEDIGPQGLARAISALKADTALWPGRFPLPAKIKAYLLGDLDSRVALSMRRIMAVNTAAEAYELPRIEYATMKTYGLNAILERSSYTTATIYAQLRDLLRVAHSDHLREERLGLPDSTNRDFFEAKGATLGLGQDGERSPVPAGQDGSSEDTW